MDSPLGYYNPNLRKQGEKSRRLAAERSDEATATRDPRTYGFMSGLLGNEYGSSPISVLDPKRAKAQQAQDVGMAVGTALNVLPALQAAKVPKTVAKGALKAINDAHLYGEGFLAPITPQAKYIIRTEKGGNWWPGSIEQGITGDLKKNVLNETGLKNLEERQGREVVEAYLKQQKKDIAINRWIDKKLHKYIQNEMGTPEDPIRKMAEEGKRIHVESEHLPAEYDDFGFNEPMNIISTNPLARQWESTVDFELGKPKPASEWKQRWPTDREGTPDWLHKLPDDTPIFNVEQAGASEPLNLRHLVDELHNAMNSESGLPDSLRFTPEQLDKITVPQAVERVAKINEWRAAQKIEASQEKARNPATQLFKEYGENNPKGLHWVELKAPEVSPKPLPPRVQVEGPNNVGAYYAYEVAPDGSQYTMGGGNSPEEAMAMANRNAVKAAKAESKKQLQEALTYEGETMGHCVGGYCDPVFETRQRIFSLRDKKGEPHVTIEMQPAGSEKISDIKSGNTKNWEIHQVKGKGNAKPKDEYIPYVQDFVKETGSKVKRDLHNTDLTSIDDWAAGGADPKMIEAAKKQFGNYATQDQFLDFAEQFKAAPPSPDPFWFNSKTGAHAPMSPEDIHAQKIQDPTYASQLGVTPEQATAYPLAPEAEPLMTGRQTGNRLSLVGLGTPTDETLLATQKMLQEKQYQPEVLDFGGGERLWEGMTPEDLLKAKSLQDLEPYKKYKSGGQVSRYSRPAKLSRYSKHHRALQR